METELYFQVSSKFHTIFHSFAFHKASLSPGGAAVALSLSVLAQGQGVASWEELVLAVHNWVALQLVPSYLCWLCRGKGKAVMPDP